MKVFAQAYKTYDGAYRRMQLEAAHSKGKRWIWGVKVLGEKRHHVVRWPKAEYQREMAISVALRALGIDD